jgi:hypothetical protein
MSSKKNLKKKTETQDHDSGKKSLGESDENPSIQSGESYLEGFQTSFGKISRCKTPNFMSQEHGINELDTIKQISLELDIISNTIKSLSSSDPQALNRPIGKKKPASSNLHSFKLHKTPIPVLYFKSK